MKASMPVTYSVSLAYLWMNSQVSGMTIDCLVLAMLLPICNTRLQRSEVVAS